MDILLQLFMQKFIQQNLGLKNLKGVTWTDEKILIKKFAIQRDCPQKLLLMIDKEYSFQCTTSQNWQKKGLNQISKYIIEWHHDEILQFYANRYPKMYTELQEVSFPYLKYMNTWGNNIESIQCLCRIYWPNLQQICLWDNKIMNLRPFRKIFAPKLRWIDLKGNLINDHSCLSQFYNNSKNFTRIHVTFQSDQRALFKLEGTDYSDISIYNNIQRSKRLKEMYVKSGIMQTILN